jgi:hypothetical protein
MPGEPGPGLTPSELADILEAGMKSLRAWDLPPAMDPAAVVVAVRMMLSVMLREMTFKAKVISHQRIHGDGTEDAPAEEIADAQ